MSWGYASQQDWDDENLSRGKGDPDSFSYPSENPSQSGQKPAHIKYIGEDRAVVNRQPYRRSIFPPTDWYDQDNDARSPLEQDLE